MTRSSRLFFFLSCATYVLLASASGRIDAIAEAVRITAATNVTLRALPSPDAQVVAQVPLGTEVRDAGPLGLDKTWIRVRLADAREGWLLSHLTKTLDPVWRWPTFDAIIADRISRKGDGFPAVAELVAFIERVAPEYTDPDGRARVEWSRLRALSTAVSLIPPKAGAREPYASWIAAHNTLVEFDQPGGRWLLANEPIWALQAKHATSALGDDIAWLAVNTGFGGECEGHVTCYMEIRNRLQGEYLRRIPAGRHVDEALATIKETADVLGAPPKPTQAYAFDKARDCRVFSGTIDALGAAVKGTHGAMKDATLDSLNALKRFCP